MTGKEELKHSSIIRQIRLKQVLELGNFPMNTTKPKFLN